MSEFVGNIGHLWVAFRNGNKKVWLNTKGQAILMTVSQAKKLRDQLTRFIGDDPLERIQSLETRVLRREKNLTRAKKHCLANKLCWFCGGDVYDIRGNGHWDVDRLMCDDCCSTFNK